MRAQALSVRRRPPPGMGVWRMVLGSAASLRSGLRRRSQERRRKVVEDAWLRFEEHRRGVPPVRDARSDPGFWSFRPPPG